LPSPGRFTRTTLLRALAGVLVLALTLGGYGFANIGRYLSTEDPLQKADAIAVLAGSRMDRPLEAVDLYQRGLAPRIVVTRMAVERSFAVLAERGIYFRADADATRDVFQKLGVPADAILIPDRIHDNTAQEAQTLRDLAVKNGWRRIIVVTSKYHLRRARFALRRELEGTGIEITMHGSRYDDVTPERWWTRRADWRWVLSESGKLVAYELGLGA
jgi:uncharacterized SAM-binding protein YcdF (DUF218 family)